jgi:DNA-binding transcriptional ArsR family regulator
MELHIDTKEILSQLDFRKLYSSEVENFFDNGGEVLGQGDCPFCANGDGSLNVNLKDGSFICFCCSAGGSVTDFLMEKFGADIETVLAFCVEFLSRDEKEEKDELETQNPGSEKLSNTSSDPEKQSEGIYLKPEIYKSDAFLSLGKNAIKILIALMAHTRTEISDDIKLSYGVLEEKYKIGRSSIPKAISQLYEKGFINIIHRGGSGQRDKNVYRLVDDYRI